MSEAIEKVQPSITREQIDLIKLTVAKGATDLELKLFLNQCQRTGLDPLSKQIHFVKRWNEKLNREEGTIQTGIDGYRAIADRTGDYAGSDDAVFGMELAGGGPSSATVTVYKMVQGQRCSFTATARWEEYFPSKEKQQFFWKKMPHGQLGKCAESLALRKAFPQQLSGVYTNEEMQQAGPEYVQVGDKVVEANTQEAANAVGDEKRKQFAAKSDALKAEMDAKKIAANPEVNPFSGEEYETRTISVPQGKRLYAIAKGAGWTDDELKKALMDGWKIEHSKDIKAGKQYEEICEFFKQGGKTPVQKEEPEDPFALHEDPPNDPF